ncbi:hypothetical protein L218DRAFT_961265 [Marasmius fiardii PR-910]|nr:hypothetical protein L218DRAFT_961265 [Marasmius fiardii PR-910]
MSTSTPSSLDSIQLPPDAIIRAHTEGKKEGLFAGLTSALASAHIGSRFMGLKRYPTIACGVITAIASGYLFTKAFTDTHIRRLKQEAAKLSSPNPDPGNESFLSDQ